MAVHLLQLKCSTNLTISWRLKQNIAPGIQKAILSFKMDKRRNCEKHWCEITPKLSEKHWCEITPKLSWPMADGKAIS